MHFAKDFAQNIKNCAKKNGTVQKIMRYIMITLAEKCEMRSHTKTNMHCPIYPRVDRCIQLPALSKLAEGISISDMVVMDQAKWTGMYMFVTYILHMDVQNNYCRTTYPNLSFNQEVHSQNPLDYTLPKTFLK